MLSRVICNNERDGCPCCAQRQGEGCADRGKRCLSRIVIFVNNERDGVHAVHLRRRRVCKIEVRMFCRGLINNSFEQVNAPVVYCGGVRIKGDGWCHVCKCVARCVANRFNWPVCNLGHQEGLTY